MRSSRLEADIDLALAIYYAANDRFYDFMATVTDALSFYEKIEVLKRSKPKKPLKSLDNVVASLNRIRKLRNVVAHSRFLPDEVLDRLLSDTELVSMLSDFPKSFNREVGYNRLRIDKLCMSHKFRNRSLPGGPAA